MSKDKKVNSKIEPYQVTARKWRPKNFEELKGQEHISKTLSHIIESGKIAHAYLFSGPRGCGKTSTARILAKCLNCETGPTIKPCDQCTNCKEIASGISPDVMEIDGASNRGVDPIRELRENVRYLPSKSKYKIYIIDEVHMLTTEAFNALLKTLEEPPEHVIFIFATTEPHKVKITIRSRCQHFTFKRMNLDTLISQLKLILDSYNIKYDDESVEVIARSADGSMRDSQSIMDQVIAYCGNEISIEETRSVLGISGDNKYYDFVTFIADKNLPAIMSLVDGIVMSGSDLDNFAIGLMETFRNLTMIKALPDESPAILDISNEQINEMKKLVGRYDLYQLREITRKTIELNDAIKNTSNQRFLFESYIYNIIDYENFVSFKEVLNRLEKLEKEIESLDDADISISEDYIHDILSKSSEFSKEISSAKSIDDNADANSDSDDELKPTQTRGGYPIKDGTNTSKNTNSPNNDSNKRIPKNYMALIGENLKYNNHMFTSQCFIKATDSKIDTDNRTLKLYYYDELSFNRCEKDKNFIEESCKEILGIPYKVIINKSKKLDYSEKEIMSNKKNIQDLFGGTEIK